MHHIHVYTELSLRIVCLMINSVCLLCSEEKQLFREEFQNVHLVMTEFHHDPVWITGC